MALTRFGNKRPASAPPRNSPLDGMLRAEREGFLRQAVQWLPIFESRVLSLKYEEHQTDKQIGELLGISTLRVTQLHGNALARLRRHFAATNRD